ISLPFCVIRSRYSRPLCVMTNSLRVPSSAWLGTFTGAGGCAGTLGLTIATDDNSSHYIRQWLSRSVSYKRTVTYLLVNTHWLRVPKALSDNSSQRGGRPLVHLHLQRRHREGSPRVRAQR